VIEHLQGIAPDGIPARHHPYYVIHCMLLLLMLTKLTSLTQSLQTVNRLGPLSRFRHTSTRQGCLANCKLQTSRAIAESGTHITSSTMLPLALYTNGAWQISALSAVSSSTCAGNATVLRTRSAWYRWAIALGLATDKLECVQLSIHC
jgi:hypothetical protein